MKAHRQNILERWQQIDPAWQFAIKTFFGIRFFYLLWTWLLIFVQPMAIQNIYMSGQPILTVFNLATNQARVFHRTVNDQLLQFQAIESDRLLDLQTSSVWNSASGTALEGPLQNSRLEDMELLVEKIFPTHGMSLSTSKWISPWQRFDTIWYTALAEHGYGYTPGDDHFPPLYSLLIRLLTPLFSNSLLAGLVITNIATLYAIKLLYETFSAWGETATVQRSLLLFLIYPASFFLFGAYSESVFLVSSLLAFRAMKDQRWAWAGFWIFCAILTRLQGVALIGVMLYMLWQSRDLLSKPEPWLGVGVAGSSALFYLMLRAMQVSSGIVPTVEVDWHARLVPPWQTYGYALRTLLSGKFTFIDFLNWAVATIFIMLIIYGWKKIPFEYNLYMLVSLFIIFIRIVDTEPLVSMSRYAIMLFPAFYILGDVTENPWLRRSVIYLFVPLNLYLSAQFFSWGWVA